MFVFYLLPFCFQLFATIFIHIHTCVTKNNIINAIAFVIISIIKDYDKVISMTTYCSEVLNRNFVPVQIIEHYALLHDVSCHVLQVDIMLSN